MLNYVGSPETVHFVNWVLHSGHVDPAALVRRATEEAEAGMPKEDFTAEEQEYYGDYLAEEAQNKLADILEEALAEWAGEYADYNHYDGWCLVNSLESYQGAGPFFLFAPLIASAIGEIDFGHAAEHVFAHVNQLAEVA